MASRTARASATSSSRRLHQIVHETLLGEPHGQLVRRRDPIDPGLEIERVDVVADEVQLQYVNP